MVSLKFLNSGNQFEIEEYDASSKKKVALKKLEPITSVKRGSFIDKAGHTFKKIVNLDIKDKTSIKRLENNTIETFTFLKENNLIPSLCPGKINFNLLRDTYAEQIKHYKEQEKDKKTVNPVYEQYADARLGGHDGEPIINISSEYVRSFVKLNDQLKGKFLKSLKENFSNSKNKEKLVLELTTLHELGHLISGKMVKDTLISRSFRDLKEETDFPIVKKTVNDKEIFINHFQNISRNVLEGFSDTFSTYLAQKHYPNDSVINTYAKVRKETSTTSSKTINAYDLNNIFKDVKILPLKNIDFLINDFFNIAVNNAITVMESVINNNPQLEQDLTKQFDYYCKDLGVVKDPKKSTIENIEDQLRKICPVMNVNNINKVSSNMLSIRNKSLNNHNGDNNNLRF